MGSGFVVTYKLRDGGYQSKTFDDLCSANLFYADLVIFDEDCELVVSLRSYEED